MFCCLSSACPTSFASLAFNELFYLFIILPFTHTLSCWRIKNINFFFLFRFPSHTLNFFFYLYFFGYVCSALHRDFKRVYVTVFCVYSPLCRCFLQASTLCLFLLLMLLLLFLTSFFPRLEKNADTLGRRAREEKLGSKERSRKRRSVARDRRMCPKEKRTGDNDDDDDTQKEVIQCRRLEIGNVCFHEFHDHPRRVDRGKLPQTKELTVRYTT